MDGIALLQWLGRWLTPESLPGWIMAIIMGAAWLQERYRGRSQPSKIVVFEANRTLFTKLPAAQKRLSMAFNGREVESLTMLDLVVHNEGMKPVEDIHFKVEVDEPGRILAIQPQVTPPGVMIDYAESDPNTWAITIGYLNPVALAQEQVRLAVFCEPEPGEIDARGGGKGWSLEFLREGELKALKTRRERLTIPATMLVTFLFIGFLFTALPLAEFVLGLIFPDATIPWLAVAGLGFTMMALAFWLWIKWFRIMERLSEPYRR